MVSRPGWPSPSGSWGGGRFQVARILLLGVLVWAGLRLGLKLIQALFAGREAGGILPLDDNTARFYRRHFSCLLSYILVVGVFGLNLLQRLGLEDDSYQILEQAFGVVLLIWVLALLRSRHFDSLRAALPGPAWVRKKGLFLTLRLLLLSRAHGHHHHQPPGFPEPVGLYRPGGFPHRACSWSCSG